MVCVGGVHTELARAGSWIVLEGRWGASLPPSVTIPNSHASLSRKLFVANQRKHRNVCKTNYEYPYEK